MALLALAALTGCDDANEEPSVVRSSPEVQVPEFCGERTSPVNIRAGVVEGNEVRLVYASNSSRGPCEIEVGSDRVQLLAANPRDQFADLRPWCAEAGLEPGIADQLMAELPAPTKLELRVIKQGCQAVPIQQR